MIVFVAYAAAAFGLVGIVTAIFWPFLDPAARGGVAVAGIVALAVQLALFPAGRWIRRRPSGLLVGLAGGALVRMVVLAIAALWAVRSGDGSWRAGLVLGLAGFLFALLLLEAAFLGEGASTEDDDVRDGAGPTMASRQDEGTHTT